MPKKKKQKLQLHFKVQRSHLNDDTLLGALSVVDLEHVDTKIELSNGVLGLTLNDSVFGTSTGMFDGLLFDLTEWRGEFVREIDDSRAILSRERERDFSFRTNCPGFSLCFSLSR